MKASHWLLLLYRQGLETCCLFKWLVVYKAPGDLWFLSSSFSHFPSANNSHLHCITLSNQRHLFSCIKCMYLHAYWTSDFFWKLIYLQIKDEECSSLKWHHIYKVSPPLSSTKRQHWTSLTFGLCLHQLWVQLKFNLSFFDLLTNHSHDVMSN